MIRKPIRLTRRISIESRFGLLRVSHRRILQIQRAGIRQTAAYDPAKTRMPPRSARRLQTVGQGTVRIGWSTVVNARVVQALMDTGQWWAGRQAVLQSCD